MDRVKSALDAFASEISKLSQHHIFATIVDSPAFDRLRAAWTDDPHLCAHLYEALASFNLLLATAGPKVKLNAHLLALGDLTKAAFLHRQAYARAEQAFAILTNLEEMSEAQDPFPGWHFSFMTGHFLAPCPDALLHMDYKIRLREKRHQWLGG